MAEFDLDRDALVEEPASEQVKVVPEKAAETPEQDEARRVREADEWKEKGNE